MRIEIKCPAKINEFLLVGHKDERGYHPVRTLFQAVSLFDHLVIEINSSDCFRCDIALEGPNIVERAWALLREHQELPKMSVFLKKRIPLMSGLGGGSSDAAGFLLAANKIAGGHIAFECLFDIAAALGADVPFFLHGGRAVGRGYGEILQPIREIPQKWVLLAMPQGIGCTTKEMYARLDASERSMKREDKGNDFESVAPQECLDLASAIKGFGGQLAGLSGSGSAVFGYFDEESQAEEARLGLGRKAWTRIVQPIGPFDYSSAR